MEEQQTTTEQTSGGKHLTLDVYAKGQAKFLENLRSERKTAIENAIGNAGSYETATEAEVLKVIEDLFTATEPEA